LVPSRAASSARSCFILSQEVGRHYRICGAVRRGRGKGEEEEDCVVVVDDVDVDVDDDD
jgi:hypothetical protein